MSAWRAAALGLLAVAGCAAPPARVVPLPHLPEAPIELRVLHAVNPRLPRMDDAQIGALLEAARATAREHFGVELVFAPVEQTTVEALFARIPRDRRQSAQAGIFDFKSGAGDLARFEQTFADALERSATPLPQMLDFVRPYLNVPAAVDRRELGALLAREQVARAQRWRDIRARDGGPALDDTPYNEFNYWDALGYGALPYELVLTNQPIASVEYAFPDLHSALRGGYSNGITSYSRESRYLTYSVWSTFGFVSDAPWVKELRGGETYTPAEAARLAGVAAAHELGHQLFHFGHPYGREACVMNPVPLLAYRAWAARLSARDCPVGSSPSMQPGAYAFEY